MPSPDRSGLGACGDLPCKEKVVVVWVVFRKHGKLAFSYAPSCRLQLFTSVFGHSSQAAQLRQILAACNYQGITVHDHVTQISLVFGSECYASRTRSILLLTQGRRFWW